jgi:hypothetical protein
MTPFDPAVVMKVIAWVQLALGLGFLLSARGQRSGAGLLAPLGAMYIGTGFFKLLSGHVPNGIRNPFSTLALVVVSLWFIREYCVSRARTRALLKQRASQPNS